MPFQLWCRRLISVRGHGRVLVHCFVFAVDQRDIFFLFFFLANGQRGHTKGFVPLPFFFAAP